MENSKKYKLCSARVRLTAYRTYDFVVTNDLLDENGEIKEETKKVINKEFEMEDYLRTKPSPVKLTLEDFRPSSGKTDYRVGDFIVREEFGDEDWNSMNIKHKRNLPIYSKKHLERNI